MYDALPPFRPDVKALFGTELPRLGVGSDLVGQYAESFNYAISWGGGKLLPVGRQRKGLIGESIRPFQDLFGMVRYLRPEHQVIQVRDKIRTGVLAWVLARLTGRKFVYWMSFPFADGFKARAVEVGRCQGWLIWVANACRARLAARVYYGFLVHRVDHLFVQSDEMLRMLERRSGVPAIKMTAVPMGLESAWLDRDRATLQAGRPPVLVGRRVLAYIGTLGRARQPDFLVRVLEAVHAHMPDALLLLIGDAQSADERQWLRDTIAASPCAGAIHLTGWISPEEGQKWLAHAEVGYSPIPRGELLDVGSPTKAIEYLAFGIPCIGNDNPDQALVLQQSGAGLCVPMTVDAFTEATLRVLASSELAERLSSRGPAWVAQNRSYSVLAPKVRNVYQRLCAN